MDVYTSQDGYTLKKVDFSLPKTQKKVTQLTLSLNISFDRLRDVNKKDSLTTSFNKDKLDIQNFLVCLG